MIMLEKIIKKILGNKRLKKERRGKDINRYLKPERRKVQRRKR